MKKSIIKEIYYGNLSEIDRSVKDLLETEEFKKMDQSLKNLEKTFSKEQIQLFNEFSMNDACYVGLEQERAYINGFKTGMCLILELLDFEPTN